MAARRRVFQQDIAEQQTVDNTQIQRPPSSHTLAHEARTAWQTDGGSISLLMALYTLQGLPMGLSGAIPLLVAGRANYKQQALFSLASLPFSLKLLWAPVVDSTSLLRFGRRKSWLIPTQILIGVAMVCSQSSIEAWMDGTPAMGELTALFFALYFLCATQDVAVDGWALTMLSERNVGWGPTCNALGQSLGYALSYVGLVALHESGLMSLATFVALCGWAFLAITVAVALYKTEDVDSLSKDDPCLAYSRAAKTLQLQPVRRLSFILLTCKLGFAAADAATNIKAVEYGLQRDKIAMLSPALLAASILFPVLCARWTTGPQPLQAFLTAARLRLGLNVATWAVLRSIEMAPHSNRAFVAFAVLSLGREFASNLMFVSQMAFFAKISDPLFGGTYMTLLNTLANLGSKWPPSLALYLLDPIQRQVLPIDPFTALLLVCTLLGCLWLRLVGPLVTHIQGLPLSTWRLSPPSHHRRPES